MNRQINIPDLKTKIVLSDIKYVIKKHPQFSIILKPLTLDTATPLFIDAIKLFKSGCLSSDELSTIGNYLFTFATKFPKSDLFQATLAAGELAFYIRYHTSRLRTFLQILDEFYEKYKNL